MTFFLGRVGIFGTIGRSAVPPATTNRAARTVDLVNTLFVNMADDKKEPEEEEELLDYEEEEEAPADAGAKGGDAAVKKGYVGIHSTGFRDFLLKPELLRAIVDCGFEHPSEGTRRSPSVRAAGRSRRLLAHFLNFGAQFDAADETRGSRRRADTQPPETRSRTPNRAEETVPGHRPRVCRARLPLTARTATPTFPLRLDLAADDDERSPGKPALEISRRVQQCNTSASPRLFWAWT